MGQLCSAVFAELLHRGSIGQLRQYSAGYERRCEVIGNGFLFCEIYWTLARHDGRELSIGKSGRRTRSVRKPKRQPRKSQRKRPKRRKPRKRRQRKRNKEIFQIYAQVSARSDSAPAGRVCEGWYTVENCVVTMIDPDGAKIRDTDGDPIEHKLENGENARTIAARPTLKIFHARRDDNADFNRPTSSLRYPRFVY
jgi:hypothetical protein